MDYADRHFLSNTLQINMLEPPRDLLRATCCMQRHTAKTVRICQRGRTNHFIKDGAAGDPGAIRPMGPEYSPLAAWNPSS